MSKDGLNHQRKEIEETLNQIALKCPRCDKQAIHKRRPSKLRIATQIGRVGQDHRGEETERAAQTPRVINQVSAK